MEVKAIGRTLLTGAPYIPAASHLSSAEFLKRQIARGLKLKEQ